MSERFFADYKKFIIIPEEEHKVGKKAFDPGDYASHYILTLSIFDAVISEWRQAAKHDIDVKQSVHSVLTEFNLKHYSNFHLQLLELDMDKSYFVLALSSRNQIEAEAAQTRVSDIVEKMITNPFYIGQSWYKLTSERGRVERRLFSFSYKEYTYEFKDEKSEL
ncbi:hypothetical protein [Mesobacillus foraminis]|uniref:hypothetical protein n=1 Tax=Mesobacillus foraminis TaxID=279826 RepID=UPI000EF486A8|nr:hypothetical protein [Mesobacillus foraminis]